MNAVLRMLRSINPVGTGPAAIFQKEVRSSGRRVQTYWVRGGYALVLAGMSGLAFVGIVNEGSMGRGARSLEELQRVAPMMAAIVLWFQFFALSLSGPILTGPALCDERQRRTLPALLTTPITAGGIVAGKLLGAMIQIVILSLIPLPVLLGVRLLGGLQGDVVLAATAVSLSSAILASSWAMLASIGATRGISAAMLAIVMMLVIHGLLPLILMAAGGWITTRFGVSLPEWIPWAICPPLTLGFTTQELFGFGGGRNPWVSAAVSVGGSLAISAALLLLTTIRLRSVMGEGGEPAARSTKRRKRSRGDESEAGSAGVEAPAQERETPSDSGDGARSGSRRACSSRTVSDHPVLWRECRASAFRSRRQMILSVLFIAALMAVAYSTGEPGGRDLHVIVSGFGALIFAAAAAVSTVGSFGSERDNHTWQILLSSPIDPRRIVWGKFVGGLARLWFVPAVLGAHLLLVAPWYGYLRVMPLAIYALNLSAVAIFLSATGLALSLVCRRTSTAGVLNIMLGLTLWLVGPALVAFMENVVSSLVGGGDSWEDLLTLNPVALAMACVEEIASRGFEMGWIASYRVGWINLDSVEFGLWCAGVWVSYALASLAILRLTWWMIRARRDRYL
jgi:ABC-type transport system involved in multi-copper enzyme maturation permease subunit